VRYLYSPRLDIVSALEAAGWQVQDLRDLDLGASLGVVVRNFPLKSGFGFADYLFDYFRRRLFVTSLSDFG